VKASGRSCKLTTPEDRYISFENLGYTPFRILEMPAAPVSPLLALTLLAAVVLLWRRSKQLHKDSAPLPPGPKRWPIIGSLLQMPRTFEHETYREWSRQYGDCSLALCDYSLRLSLLDLYKGSDIIYTNVLGQSIVVLDKYEDAVELLNKRSAMYSSRFVILHAAFCVEGQR
jgi:hypothetical protein